MKKLFFVLILILSFVIVIGSDLNIVNAQSSQTIFPNLSMPKEYINYTITDKNGSLWTKVEGKYPITILNNSDNSQIDFPMVYPIPPNTKNIQIKLNDKELSWTNYSLLYPDLLHHTAIGDWSMVYCLLENVSDSFLLEIEYEHPIQKENNDYQFLYDLNINPYLFDESPKSTAYFTINFESDISNIQLFTTKTDTTWISLNYSLQEEESNKIVTCQINSEYLEQLQGDLLVSFEDLNSQEVSNFFLGGSIILAIVFGLGIFVFLSKYRRRLQDKK